MLQNASQIKILANKKIRPNNWKLLRKVENRNSEGNNRNLGQELFYRELTRLMYNYNFFFVKTDLSYKKNFFICRIYRSWAHISSHLSSSKPKMYCSKKQLLFWARSCDGTSFFFFRNFFFWTIRHFVAFNDPHSILAFLKNIYFFEKIAKKYIQKYRQITREYWLDS